MVSENIYSKYAQEYDAWFDAHELEFNLELDAIRNFLPASGEGIEVGVGTGRFASALGISLGVEPAKNMAALAVEKGIQVISGKAELLPVENNKYDYVLMVTTDCFLDAPEEAYKEIYRILKSHGKAIIGFIDKESALGKRYSDKKNTSKFYRDAKFHSTKELVELLRLSGFNNFEFSQALLPVDVDVQQRPCVKPGFGEGSFVVLCATKN